MKKTILGFSILALFAYCTIVFLFTASPMRFHGGDGGWFCLPCDLELVVAENELLCSGIDPYDVYVGKKNVPGYIGSDATAGASHSNVGDMRVMAHPPWVYTAFMPLTLLSHRSATFAYFCVMMSCMALLVLCGVWIAQRNGCARQDAIIAACLSVLAISFPVFQDFLSMNWALVTLSAAVLMAVCLNKGHDILAGVCWAFVMVKPQIGLAFAIPLIIKCRVKTCAAAVVTCLVASIPPSLMSGTSFWKMIFVIPGTYVHEFWGCGTMPRFVVNLIPSGAAVMAGLVIGAVVCALMTYKMKSEKDWFFFLMPAAACSMSWTYARCYSHVMAWFFFICLAASIVKGSRARSQWIIAVFALFFTTRAWNFIHMLPTAIPSVFPVFLPSEEWHYNIDTINSLVDLVLVFSFCYLHVKEHEQNG